MKPTAVNYSSPPIGPVQIMHLIDQLSNYKRHHLSLRPAGDVQIEQQLVLLEKVIYFCGAFTIVSKSICVTAILHFTYTLHSRSCWRLFDLIVWTSRSWKLF
jgi:hypothetical protein